ncbi:MAG: 16S rRNA (cytosine(967)-C(5))-methyltransferase RsmB [Clostridia bacterium]|nr:16S rRNA (cytosine(967)-C(5))-methyltransferase RsmB [Clostridia bacterium]
MASVREIAWNVLNKCEAAGQYSNIALDSAIKRADLAPADRGLLTTLVYGTIERRLTLDAVIDSLASRGEIAPDVRMLLRMGIYQMAYLDRVPDHAAVNECVSLAPKRAKGFVNAILRAFARGGKAIPCPDVADKPIRYLSVNYSVCEALCERFVADFGLVRAEEILAAFGKQPPLSVRVNTLKSTREALIARWREDGFSAEPTRESRNGIHLPDRAPVTALYGFDEGLFFVQDEASQLCVAALDAHAGMRVLDACACPGSKSFGAAIDMENRGEVVSCDLHQNKLSLVTSGAERLGISIIQTYARDARDGNAEWVEGFDRVLCDVPCSGFGVLAKKPELRYKDPAESERLPEIQRAILESACAYVKKGGRLVYSTCTLLPDENERNVAAFLASHGEFSLVKERTLYPDTDNTDGFYFAVMERRA